MLRRIQIELSHVDRGIYQTLDLRLAQHPSEIGAYLLTRVIAFALSFENTLEFSPAGLGDPDVPAIRSAGPNGGVDLWIEIGNPSAKRLHKASKAAGRVVVYTYKNVSSWLLELRSSEIYKSEAIELYALDPKFLSDLEATLEKNNRWILVVQENHLSLQAGAKSLSTDVERLSIAR
jgi:uncharacterized protein YaeQ